MNNKVKLINIVSIACRAGKVMSGEFVIEKALSSKNNFNLKNKFFCFFPVIFILILNLKHRF